MNDNFPSTHPAGIASKIAEAKREYRAAFASVHPAGIASAVRAVRHSADVLCLSASRRECIFRCKNRGNTSGFFASVHPAGIASFLSRIVSCRRYTLPQCIPQGLHQTAMLIANQNLLFASVHPAGIASRATLEEMLTFVRFASVHPAGIASQGRIRKRHHRELCLSASRRDCIQAAMLRKGAAVLCLSASRRDCISNCSPLFSMNIPLPQCIPQGLHRQECTNRMQFSVGFAVSR